MARETKALFLMVLIRLFSGTTEMVAAFLMLRTKNVRSALLINATLGLVGPVALIGASVAGLSGLAGRISLDKALLLLCGVGLVYLGTR